MKFRPRHFICCLCVSIPFLLGGCSTNKNRTVTPSATANESQTATPTTTTVTGNIEISEDDVRTLLLTGYTKWETLEAQTEVTDFSDSNEPQTFPAHVWVQQPDKVRIDGVPITGGGVTRIFTFENLYILSESGSLTTLPTASEPYALWLEHLPNSMEEVSQRGNSIAVDMHPLRDAFVAHHLEELFPQDLAQSLSAKVEILGEDMIAERATWHIRWLMISDVTYPFEYWIDQETGIILKLLAYDLDQQTLIEGYEVTSITYDLSLTPDLFDPQGLQTP